MFEEFVTACRDELLKAVVVTVEMVFHSEVLSSY